MIGSPRRLAFTLVELLIVIIIIAVLAAVAIPRVTDASRRAKEAAIRDQISNLRLAVSMFSEDTDRYPMQLDDLALETAPAQGYNSAGLLKPIQASNYRGPYIQGSAVPNEMAGWIEYDGASKGRIFCPVPGIDLRGVPFSSY